MDIIQKIAWEFKLTLGKVKNTVELLDAGNTVPFIARYRKEITGGMSDEVLRDLVERLTYLRNLEARREEIKRLLTEQGVLDEELERKLAAAEVLVELEDIYRPFRPKRKTRASVAKEKGLAPLTELLLTLKEGNIEAEALRFVDAEKGVGSTEEALAGAMDILAEEVADHSDHRKIIRELTWEKGLIISKGLKKERSPYEMYYEFREAVKSIPSHRVLAINRGEREEFLGVKIEAQEEEILTLLKLKAVPQEAVAASMVEAAVVDGYHRLIAPSIEREVRKELTEKAEEQSIKVFAANLKKLLLQPPVRGKNVLALDPAYRTGCKVAVVNATGKLLTTDVVYPTPPQNETAKAAVKLKDLISQYNVEIIDIGNGTASRETESFTADLIKTLDRPVVYTIVNEAGASVYSASKLGQEEFPQLDVSLRSAISIARRLLDPLAELVKIDPKSIGVGQYQHDVNQKRLGETLAGVVEDCVNSVGIDLNTASWALLSYVAGLTKAQAKKIVQYREANGEFRRRQELLKVPGLGAKTFEQCAGFTRIAGGDNPLDNTGVHPESYEVTERLLEFTGAILEDFTKSKVELGNLGALAEKLGAGLPTLKDIIKELEKPGRDPREELPPPVFKSEVKELEDLNPGMLLQGVVRNVVDFGAFIDIGVHQDGLVHISELSTRYVKNPLEVVQVGDVVKVKVLEIDLQRKRVSLSMKI